MSVSSFAVKLGQKLPPRLAMRGKELWAWPRYRAQLRAARAGWRAYGERYPQPLVFVAGLPKSGTTWVEQMLSTFPGFVEVMIPEAIRWEMRTGGSHDFEVPADFVSRFERRLVVAKLHVHGSDNNHAILRAAELPYLVVYRDLRDVAVSYYHYVRRTRWHPHHALFAPLDTEAGLLEFARRLLPAYVAWIDSWRRRAAEPRYLEVRYEQLLADTAGMMRRVVSHFDLPGSEEQVARVVERNRFEAYTQGRSRGTSDASSFFRRGVAGDWASHFTPRVAEAFDRVAGEQLVRLGYEDSREWIHADRVARDGRPG